MTCFALTTTATEADVLRQAWLRKTTDLQCIPTDSGTDALFRSSLGIQVLRSKTSIWKKANAVEHAQVVVLEEDAWLARRAAVREVPAPSAPRPIERRSPMQTVMELLPTLTPGERHCVLFKLAVIDRPAVECREMALLKTKQAMQEIIRSRPLAEWGEALAPFVQAALQEDADDPDGFKRSSDACVTGLRLLLAHPPPERGFKKTRRPELDPPVRVVDIRKKSFYALHVHEPDHFPAKPPPDAGKAFTVWLQVQDVNGEWSPQVPVPWYNFCENAAWKASVNLDFSLWSSSPERWRYNTFASSIYAFDAWQRRLAAPSPAPRALSSALKRYYESAAYDRDLETQREREERARKRARYTFRLDDVEPEVLFKLDQRRRAEQEE